MNKLELFKSNIKSYIDIVKKFGKDCPIESVDIDLDAKDLFKLDRLTEIIRNANTSILMTMNGIVSLDDFFGETIGSDIENIAIPFGVFLGELFVSERNYHWVWNEEYNTACIKTDTGSTLFPISKMIKIFESYDGSEGTPSRFYYSTLILLDKVKNGIKNQNDILELNERLTEDDIFYFNSIAKYQNSETVRGILQAMDDEQNPYYYFALPESYQRDSDVIESTILVAVGNHFTEEEWDKLFKSKNLSEIISNDNAMIEYIEGFIGKLIYKYINKIPTKKHSFTSDIDYTKMKKEVDKIMNNLENFINTATDTIDDVKRGIIKSIENEPINYVILPDEYKKDKDITKTYINTTDILIADDIPSTLRKDKDIALLLIKKEAYNFKYLSKELKEDKDFVLTAININPSIFSYVSSKKLCDDEEVIELAVSKDKSNIFSASDRLKNNKNFMLKLYKLYNISLHYCASSLQDDEEIVLLECKQNYYYFNSASNRLKNDKKFVTKILEQYPECYQFISDELKDDKELAYQSINLNKWNYTYMSKNLKSIEELANIFINEYPKGYKYLDTSIKNNKEFNLNLVKKDGLMIQYMNSKMKKNKEIQKIAISQNKEAKKYI